LAQLLCAAISLTCSVAACGPGTPAPGSARAEQEVSREKIAPAAGNLPIDCTQLGELSPPNASAPLVSTGPITAFVPAPHGTPPQKIFLQVRFGCFRQPRTSVHVSWSRAGEASRRPQRLEVFLANGQHVSSSPDLAPPLNWYQLDSLRPGTRYVMRVHTRTTNGWVRGEAVAAGSHGCDAPSVNPASLDPAELSPAIDQRWFLGSCQLIDCSQYQQAVLLFWQPPAGQPAADAQRIVAELAGEEQNPKRSQLLPPAAREAWWYDLRGGQHRFFVERRTHSGWIRSNPTPVGFPGCPQLDQVR
jgi:hypothetical protein